MQTEPPAYTRDDFAGYPVLHPAGAQGDACVHLSGCDLAGPTCPPELTCTPWYEPTSAPPGFEDLGACILP